MRGNYVNKLCKLLSKLKDLSLLIMGMLLLHRCIQKLKKKSEIRLELKLPWLRHS